MIDKIKMTVHNGADGQVEICLEVPFSEGRKARITVNPKEGTISVTDTFRMTKEEFAKFEAALSIAKQMGSWDVWVYNEKAGEEK